MLTKKLNAIEVLISKAWIDLSVSHGRFVLVKTALREYGDKKGAMKIPKIFNSDNNDGWCKKRNINLKKRVYWY